MVAVIIVTAAGDAAAFVVRAPTKETAQGVQPEVATRKGTCLAFAFKEERQDCLIGRSGGERGRERAGKGCM